MLKRLLSDMTRRRAASTEPCVPPGNPLEGWLAAHRGRRIDKWTGYFEIYHRHFAAFRGRSPVVVEIGVFGGGSLEMWLSYFGPGTRLIGVDVNPQCRKWAPPGAEILIGDQADRAFLAEIKAAAPHIDILIDDGGHTMAQQLTTFEVLFPHLQPHGVYLCEDTHTSYWPTHDGGYRRSGTYVEFCKGLVDQLTAWHSLDREVFAPDDFTRSAHSIHFYNSVVVIEKRPMRPPGRTKYAALASGQPGATEASGG